MKKILALVVLCVLATLCLCACNPQEELTVNDLNDMLNQVYSKTQLEIKSVLDGEQLASSFEITKNGNAITIVYSIQQLAEISLENTPDSYKTVSTGSIVVENGEVVSQSGDKVDMALEQLAVVTIKFDSDYFKQSDLESNKFSANVSNPASFLGVKTFDGTNMTVEANFDSLLKDITICYTSASQAQVEIVYTFTK